MRSGGGSGLGERVGRRHSCALIVCPRSVTEPTPPSPPAAQPLISTVPAKRYEVLARDCLPASLALALTLALACAPLSEVEPQAAPGPAIVVEPPTTEPREPPPAEPEPPPEPAFEPVTRGSGTCIVTITGVIEAQEYRGAGPITPALEASLSADPEFARMYNSHSHGDHHIQCHYAVRLAHLPDKQFRWRDVHNNLTRELTVDVCTRKLTEVADDIIQTTKQCTDFAAGGYWGYVLEPIS